MNRDSFDRIIFFPFIFSSISFFIFPVFRLILFRITSFALPTSFIIALSITGSFIYLSFKLRNFFIEKYIFICTVSVFFVFLIFSINFDNKNTLNQYLATTWIYFLTPCAAMLIGNMSYDWKNLYDITDIDLEKWINLSIFFLFTGVIINSFDIYFLGENYSSIYKDFGTVAPAQFGEIVLPRLAGAYFSGLDLAIAIIFLMSIQSVRRKKIYSIINYLLIICLLFTFTRNVYLIFGYWFIVNKISTIKISRLAILGYLSSPLLSFLTISTLLFQLNSGKIEINDETSSLLTRLSSWTVILDEISNSPMSLFFGLGVTQNILTPGESSIYAIDNFFWELICYGGLISYLLIILFINFLRNKCVVHNNELGRLVLIIISIIPIAGIFNNMSGSILMVSTFLMFGLITRND